MNHRGRSIRLFLVDDTPTGRLTAEIMNWTGHVLSGPRSLLGELLKRPECARTGVYFLIGPDPDDNLRTRVYIGESDNVSQRLRQHNRPESSGGKDFWERVCLVTSKDQNLTKAHVKYLESKLIAIATSARRCVLDNGTAHKYDNLPESDCADMAFFLKQMRIVLPVLGCDFLNELKLPSTPVATVEATAAAGTSPRFILEVPSHGVSAQGQEFDGQFFVLKGSRVRTEWVGIEHSYQKLYQQLKLAGLLTSQDEYLVFADDYAFNSPSAAAAVVCGRSTNGRTSWVLEGTGQTYAAWQEQQLTNVVPASEAE